MTDDEVYKQCETAQGCLDYIEYACAYFGTGWVTLEIEKVPVLQKLLDDGVIEWEYRHGLVWYRKKTKGQRNDQKNANP